MFLCAKERTSWLVPSYVIVEDELPGHADTASHTLKSADPALYLHVHRTYSCTCSLFLFFFSVATSVTGFAK